MPRDEASNPTAMYPTDRSNRFWDIRLRSGFANYSGSKMKPTRPRVDVNLDELDRVLDGARQEPLSETDYEKLKGALHTLAAMLVRPRNTEKTSAVLEEAGAETQPGTNTAPSPGHGRNGAGAFGGAQKVEVTHQKL